MIEDPKRMAARHVAHIHNYLRVLLRIEHDAWHTWLRTHRAEGALYGNTGKAKALGRLAGVASNARKLYVEAFPSTDDAMRYLAELGCGLMLTTHENGRVGASWGGNGVEVWKPKPMACHAEEVIEDRRLAIFALAVTITASLYPEILSAAQQLVEGAVVSFEPEAVMTWAYERQLELEKEEAASEAKPLDKDPLPKSGTCSTKGWGVHGDPANQPLPPIR